MSMGMRVNAIMRVPMSVGMKMNTIMTVRMSAAFTLQFHVKISTCDAQFFTLFMNERKAAQIKRCQ